MIEQIGTNKQPLIESGSSTGQPVPPGGLRGNDVDVSVQVNYASLVEKAMQPPQTDDQRVQQARADGTEEKVADYITIDPNRLKELDKDTLQELHQDGTLAAIYGQLFSLENWNRLIVRRNLRLNIE